MTDLLDRADSAPAASRSPAPDASPDAAPVPDRAGRGLLAALLAGAAAIHFAMAPSHLGETSIEGAGFLAAAWAQLALAAAVLTRRARRLPLTVAGVNAVLVALWAVSRTAGLPFGEHAGHPESVSIVDGVAVGLEVAAVAVAAAVARRGTWGTGRWRRPALASAVAAVVLATGAVASPSARDHAAGSHGDHESGGVDAGGHGHAGDAAAAADDQSGFSELVNGHHHDRSVEPLTTDESVTLARQLTATVDLMERYPTLGDAQAAGYRRHGPFTPGLGTHYAPPDAPLNMDGDMDAEDLANAYIIYDGLEPAAPIAGFMYLASGVEPQGFAGPNDHWHYHDNVCVFVHPDGTLDSPLAADAAGTTEARCDEIGGQWIQFTGYMVHLWNVPGYESPDGMFTEVNRAITCPDGTYHRIPLDDILGKDDLCVNS